MQMTESVENVDLKLPDIASKPSWKIFHHFNRFLNLSAKKNIGKCQEKAKSSSEKIFHDS